MWMEDELLAYRVCFPEARWLTDEHIMKYVLGDYESYTVVLADDWAGSGAETRIGGFNSEAVASRAAGSLGDVGEYNRVFVRCNIKAPLKCQEMATCRRWGSDVRECLNPELPDGDERRVTDDEWDLFCRLVDPRAFRAKRRSQSS